MNNIVPRRRTETNNRSMILLRNGREAGVPVLILVSIVRPGEQVNMFETKVTKMAPKNIFSVLRHEKGSLKESKYKKGFLPSSLKSI